MPLRAPPRKPPFEDFDELVADLSTQFNAADPVTNEPMVLPEAARAEWTADELHMWYASGGMIAPPDNPKLRAAAAAMDRQGMKAAAQMERDEILMRADEAARKAPWLSKLDERDRAKVKMYRDTAVAFGHPRRAVAASDLYPADDPILVTCSKQAHLMPFLKHILNWDEVSGQKKVVYGEEGFTHGAGAALRGFDVRMYWDASSLKVVGAVRFSLGACICWQPDGGDKATHMPDGSTSWAMRQVHGGCIEAVLDDLTAEVMKINVAPQNVTAEMTVKLKAPISPDTTYRIEAEISDVSPPRVMVVGRILTAEGLVAAEATAKMAMIDKLDGVGRAPPAKFPPVDDASTNRYSLARVYASDGGGAHSAPTAARGSIAETVAELQRLQQLLVSQLQSEYFCDDVEPPAEAFGWAEGRLREYFENGGE